MASDVVKHLDCAARQAEAEARGYAIKAASSLVAGDYSSAAADAHRAHQKSLVARALFAQREYAAAQEVVGDGN